MSNAPIKSLSARSMSEAAQSFLGSLDEEQKQRANFEYMDGERLFWYYPPLNRHGLPLMSMRCSQAVMMSWNR